MKSNNTNNSKSKKVMNKTIKLMSELNKMQCVHVLMYFKEHETKIMYIPLGKKNLTLFLEKDMFAEHELKKSSLTNDLTYIAVSFLTKNDIPQKSVITDLCEKLNFKVSSASTQKLTKSVKYMISLS